MRRRFIAAIIGSGCAAILLAACGSSGSSTPTSTALATGTPTVRPSASAAASPTAAVTEPAASPTPVPATQAPAAQPTAVPPTQPPAVQPTKAPPPPPPPATQSRTVVAANIAFDPKQLTASAGVPLTITLDNRDAGVQHDIIIYAPDGSKVAETSVITGPATASTASFTPASGTYRFKCSVHPQQMFGAISVQ